MDPTPSIDPARAGAPAPPPAPPPAPSPAPPPAPSPAPPPAPAPAVGRPLRPQPLWARVDANRAKVGVFVVAYVGGSAVLLTIALVAVPGLLLGLGADFIELVPASVWYARLPWIVLASFAGLLLVGAILAAIQLANAEDWVRNRFAGRKLGPDEELALAGVVGDMALAAGVPVPDLVGLEAGSVNAYALGNNRSKATIGVTRGFLTVLTLDEQRAVVATLVARVLAGDILFGTALAALMGPLRVVRESRTSGAACCGGCLSTAPGEGADSAGRGCNDVSGCAHGCSGCADVGDLFDSDNASGCLFGIAVAVFLAVVAAITYAAVLTAAWIVTLWGRMLQRTSYEKADAEGMLLLKDPAPMLSALKKAVLSSTQVGDEDPSYDGIFYAPTSGTAAVERVERRRFARLCEVLGVDGAAASLDG